MLEELTAAASYMLPSSKKSAYKFHRYEEPREKTAGTDVASRLKEDEEAASFLFFAGSSWASKPTASTAAPNVTTSKNSSYFTCSPVGSVTTSPMSSPATTSTSSSFLLDDEFSRDIALSDSNTDSETDSELEHAHEDLTDEELDEDSKERRVDDGSEQDEGSDHSGRKRICEFCSATRTPMWRRGPQGKGTLCNACGVRWSIRRKKSKNEASKAELQSIKKDSKRAKEKAVARKSTSSSVLESLSVSPSRAVKKKTKRVDVFRSVSDGSVHGCSPSASSLSRSPSLLPSDSNVAKTITATAVQASHSEVYYCRYCEITWPSTFFRNRQQFGAHCSNCSRKRKVSLDLEHAISVPKKLLKSKLEAMASSGTATASISPSSCSSVATAATNTIVSATHLNGAATKGRYSLSGSNTIHQLAADYNSSAHSRIDHLEAMLNLREQQERCDLMVVRAELLEQLQSTRISVLARLEELKLKLATVSQVHFPTVSQLSSSASLTVPSDAAVVERLKDIEIQILQELTSSETAIRQSLDESRSKIGMEMQETRQHLMMEKCLLKHSSPLRA